jgi:hypothetical protein
MTINFVYLRNQGTEFLNADKDIIILKPSLLKLPKKQLNGTKMTLYNETGNNVTIDVNS